ncbi:MAG: hypothetical protein AMJ69_06820 [Gammaproteobacteria bacterium SG8_47]|nr:MAG: hypothetical protein AMJ69_06820 [Gammaproteobacteria bacterium SG8_47]
MQIKRFFAPDMRQAIRLVREEIGPDAVILSNERVAGGVEIVAATDYDEAQLAAPESAAQEQTPPPAVAAQPPSTPTPGANLKNIWSQEPTLVEMRDELRTLRGLLVDQLSGLAWGELARHRPVYARLLRRLLALGLAPELAGQLASTAQEQRDYDHSWRLALGGLAHRLPVAGDDLMQRGGVVALVGPTGVGKTTTAAKLAARFVLRNGANRVAFVTTDCYRVGAQDQLRSYARILGVPMHVAQDSAGLHDTLANLYDKDLVIVDTAGMSQRDMRLTEQLGMLDREHDTVHTYLVLATNMQRSVVYETVKSFTAVPLAGCMLTKIDEAVSLGAALSALIEYQLPVAYVSDGQRVPEDLHIARQHSLVARSVSIMQQPGVTNEFDELAAVAMGEMVAHAHG